MSYKLKTVDRGEYVQVTVQGDNSPENVLSYLSEIREICVRHGRKKLLIEENLQGPSIGTVAVFEVVTKASRNVWPAIVQIAYVDVNQEHDIAPLKFAETVASNRGVNVRVFSNVEGARKWLTSAQTGTPGGRQ